MRTGAQVSSKASIKGTASFRPKQTIVRTSPKLGITRLPELCFQIHGLAGSWVFPGTKAADQVLTSPGRTMAER